jgi:hypothetical protein
MVLLLAAGVAMAQNQRTGTSAATELLIPVGARNLAMGGAGMSNAVGVEAIYWNPAGLGRLTHSAEGMFSNLQYIADIKVNYGAVAAKFGEFGNLGFSIKALDFGKIPLTTVDDPENRSGATFSPTYVTIGLTYSRELTDAVAAGLTVKLVSETIDRVSASGMAFDLGLQYTGLVGVQGLHLGVAVKNIGPQLKYDGSGLYRSAVTTEGLRPEQKYKTDAASFELPASIEIGVGYSGRVGDNMNYTVSGVFANNNLYLDEYKLGAEYGVNLAPVKVFARGGYSFVPQITEAEDNIFGATLGFGLVFEAGSGVELGVDYAYRQVDLFSANNVIALRIGF